MRDHARAPLGIDTTGIGTTGRLPDPSLIVHVSQASIPWGGGGGVVAPSFGSNCEMDCKSGGGDKQR